MKLDDWLVVIAFACAGCYGGGDDDGNGGGNGASVTCAEDEFALEGTLDGVEVSARGALGGHAWIQSNDYKTLDTPFEGGGSFHAEWPEIVADGETTSILGSVVMPPGAQRAGETLNYASGSMTKLDNGVTFTLAELASQVTCVTDPCPAEAVDGSLRGCVMWQDISP